MTRTKSIPTHYRTCLEYPCTRTIPADSDELRCPGCKAKRFNISDPFIPAEVPWALTETRQRRTFVEDDIAATTYGWSRGPLPWPTPVREEEYVCPF